MNPGGEIQSGLGQTVGTLPLRAPVFVPPGAAVVEAARAMRAARATACLVGGPDRLEGILTERDLVRAVAEERDLHLPVETLMSPSVICVGMADLVAEATLRMVRHAIRRLAVIGADGRCLAILEEHDMLAARADSPVALAVEAGRAQDALALRRMHDKLPRVVALWTEEGVGVTGVGSLAAGLRDQLLIRAAQMALERQDGAKGPGPLALAVLGSEGRREQYLATDQDNCLILGSDADGDAAGDFAVRLLALLAEAGLPPCPHQVTADNPAWRMSLAEWMVRVESMAQQPDEKAVLALSLLADMRHVFGQEQLVTTLREHMARCVREHAITLRLMAREACRFAPPGGLLWNLPEGLFGGSKTGKTGLDVKKGGIFPLTQGARVLGLELGLAATGTLDRLEGACQAGVLGRDTTDSLKQAYAFLQELRLRFQVGDVAQGRPPGNTVARESLSRLERSRLKDCLRAVAAFQGLLSNHYRLHLLT